MTIIIRNAHIVNADRQCLSDILIRDGKIISIEKGVSFSGVGEHKEIDATGKLVFPGGVDPHVHMHLSTGAGFSSDDFRSGSRAALSGGTTSIIDFVTPRRGQSLLDALEARKIEAAGCQVDHSFHISPVEWRESTADEIRKCIRLGYKSFKLYMAYKESIGIDETVIEKVMQVVAAEGGIVIMHCEMGDEIEHLRNRLASEGHLSPAAHPISRPPHTESQAVGIAIRLAAKTHCPLYVVHVSATESVQHIREARNNGLQVMGEACPHHLLLDESVYNKPFEQSAPYVLSPPLRSHRHRDALWQGLQDGTLQTVGTDHCPFMMHQKKKGIKDFRKIANGAGGVEHRLTLLYTFGVLQNKISLQDFVKLTSTNPAKIFGMYPQKGIITEGADADIIIWDPKKEQTITSKNHQQNCDHNIYEGFRTKGSPSIVIAKGKVSI
jgi:dihydropyrimidinase